VLGVPLTPCTTAEAVERVADWVRSNQHSFATFTGVHGVMEAQRSASVLRAHEAAGMVACDGAPMVWGCRWAGSPIPARVTGRDFMTSFCARAEKEGWTSFLYGGKPGGAERLADALVAQFPAIKIVGSWTPPFRPLTESEDAEIVTAINESRANLVWVGLSTPKQELWMADHCGRLHAQALFGVGAAFDYLSGELDPAPRWMQRAGFEWLFRAAQEPRRLVPRYVRNNLAFLLEVLHRRPRMVETPSDLVIGRLDPELTHQGDA
jgi:N-acetylglucosaminyldiphosphoundecaprenol N-acetyl-beta-D-mannosaminyltransferase